MLKTLKLKGVICISIILLASLVLLNYSALSKETTPAQTPPITKEAVPSAVEEKTPVEPRKIVAPIQKKEKAAPSKTEGTEWSPAKVMQDFWTSDFWLLILFAIGWGAFGGFVYELLILQGNIEKPHQITAAEIPDKLPYAIPPYLYDLGIISRIIIGAAAAVAALWVIQPSTLISLGAVSLIAGSAGSSILRSMQDRLNAALTGQRLAETQKKMDQQKEKLNQLEPVLTKLKDELATKSSSPPGQRSIVFNQGTAVDLSELEKAEKLVSEISGISITI
jgi:hypothetical protein